MYLQIKLTEAERDDLSRRARESGLGLMPYCYGLLFPASAQAGGGKRERLAPAFEDKGAKPKRRGRKAASHAG